MGAYAYAVTNALANRGASDFTFSSSASNKGYLNDGRMDRRSIYTGSVSSGYNVIIDAGAAVALMGFAVLNHNFALQKSDAKLLIEGADDGAMSTNLVTAKAVTTLQQAAPQNKDHVLQFASVTKRYWRLTWTWTTGSVTNPAIGEIFAYASAVQLARKGIYGGIGEKEDLMLATVDFPYGDSQSLYLAGPIREKLLRFSDLNTSQRDEIRAMWRATNGPVTPLLWIESYEASASAAAAAEQDCIFGRNEQPSHHWSEGDFALYQPDDFSIRSLGREVGN